MFLIKRLIAWWRQEMLSLDEFREKQRIKFARREAWRRKVRGPPP